MTSYSDDFVTGVTEALLYGEKVRIRYYTTAYGGAGSYYDDDVALTESGTALWTSGVVLPINQSRGSNDAVLMEQGKVLSNDTKLYIQGNIDTSGTIKFGLGSGIGSPLGEYYVLPDGIIKYTVNQVDVLKKIYLRRLSNGSLIGE